VFSRLHEVVVLCVVQNVVSCRLIAEVSTGFRLLSAAATHLTSGNDDGDEDAEPVAAEAESTNASSDDDDDDDDIQSANSSDDAEGLCLVPFLISS